MDVHHEHGAEAPGLPAPVGPAEPPAGTAAGGFEAVKQCRTLQARAALAGCELREIVGGGYLLTRNGMTRELRDLAAAQALLAEISPPGGCLP